MRVIHILISALSALALFSGAVVAGPVEVRGQQTGNSSFHVGPQARSTFELVEEYRPLSTAFNQKDRARAHASSLSKGPPVRAPHPASELSPAQVLIDFGTQQQEQQPAAGVKPGRDSTHQWQPWQGTDQAAANVLSQKRSQWLEWTRWSECANGERIRIRQCLQVNNVKCEGSNIERQKCFTFQHSNIPFASDPLVIEKEIIGAES